MTDKPHENGRQAYFEYKGYRYRVTITQAMVWIERHWPHADNVPTGIPPENVLDSEYWNIDMLPQAFDEYELQLSASADPKPPDDAFRAAVRRSIKRGRHPNDEENED